MAAYRIYWLRTAHRGNTISEYGMIGVLVLIASIAMLSLLGSNLNVVMGSMRSELNTKSITASTMHSLQVGEFTKAKSKAMSDAVDEALWKGSTQAETIQVTAANGSSLLGLFNNLANSLFSSSSGAMSEAQIQEMERNMSNQAFAIAELERQMQDILNYTGDDPAKFMKLSISYKDTAVPAITLASGILTQVAKLTDMMKQLEGTAASAEDKAKLQALVTKISGDAAAIYSKSMDLQSQYQAILAAEEKAKAEKALAEAASTTDVQTKAQKEATASTALETAQTAEEKSTASADAATNTAEKAGTTGSTPESATTTASATTTKSAGVMCETGNGKTLPGQCVTVTVTVE